ncbi:MULTISPECIES: hypothetical protein [Clostridia]|uniref:hypothetical protein n=1 Tax=Clostridia TaxID=186801 RepID=UPI002A8CB2D8|nr:hypothetical protein [Peptostreptococcus porci]MDY5098722.1 hypothetical protein [Clostridium sp.]MDY5437498.1 hypothetical protein [Peptostreptococcus porci]
MLVISSQNKKVLSEVEGVLTGAEIGKRPSWVYGITSKMILELGKYESEERAIKVVHDIRRQVETWTESDSVKDRKRTGQKFVHQMPRE